MEKNLNAKPLYVKSQTFKSLRLKFERIFDALEATRNLKEAASEPQEYCFQTPDLLYIDVPIPSDQSQGKKARVAHPRIQLILCTLYADQDLGAALTNPEGFLSQNKESDLLYSAYSKAINLLSEKSGIGQTKFYSPAKDRKLSILAVPNSDGVKFVRTKDIIWLCGERGYTRIYLQSGEHILSSKNLGYFRDAMADQEFYSIHRSYIINVSMLSQYYYDGHVLMTDGTQLPVSRMKRKAFLEFLSDR